MSKNKKHTSIDVTSTSKISSTTNFLASKKGRKEKKLKSTSEYVEGILGGNRIMLSQAITLIESSKEEHHQLASAILEKCLPHTGESIRIGVTGSPGVGKSTFIESFGLHLLTQKRQVAVLAIDPSSKVSKGSILGDKTRMEQLSAHSQAFIRPSPAGDSLGGVAKKTRETILLCEAAGFDTILIETVGVGQSETTVHSMVDFFLLLLLPGAGDELQGIKKGIVEMADLVAINKADGDREKLAVSSKRAYRNALHLMPAKNSGWNPKVVSCSALEKIGIAEIWKIVSDYHKITKENGFFESRRKAQLKLWLHDTIEYRLKNLFYKNPKLAAKIKSIEEAIQSQKLLFSKGAEELVELFMGIDRK